MKCLEYRDLAELLRDGVLAASVAEEARLHADGCGDCRAFESECALLLAPLGDLPPGPFLPEGPLGLPPWAAGSSGALLALLATAGITGAAALSILGSGSGVDRETGEAGGAAIERTEFADAPGVPGDLSGSRGEPDPGAAPAVPIGGGVLSGRIVGADGAPVPDARVSVLGGPSATTDAAGVFTLRGLAAPGSSRLRLEAPGLAAEEFLGPHIEPGQVVSLEELVVAAPAPAEITVLAPDARPAAGARVHGCRTPLDLKQEDWTDFSRGTGHVETPAAVDVTAGPDGIARIPALPRGTWSFTAELVPFARSRPAVVAARAGPGPFRAALLLDAATALDGVVVDDGSGEPVPGAEVLWVRMLDQGKCEDPRCNGRTVAGPGGQFRFESVPAVPLKVFAARPGIDFLCASTTVDAGRLPLAEIRLPRAETFSGTCIDDATGAPAEGVDVRISAQAGAMFRATADTAFVRSGPDGRFEFPGVPAGGTVRAECVPGGAWTTAEPRIPRDAGAARDVALRVQRAGSIRGKVRDGSGRPAAGMEVRALARVLPGGIETRFPATVAATRAGADGSYVLENVPATTVLVVAHLMPAVRRPGPVASELLRLLSEPEPPPDRIEVAPGAEVTHDLAAWTGAPAEAAPAAARPTGPLLRGRVVDEAGAPVKGVRLYAELGDKTAIYAGPGTVFLRMPAGTDVPVASDGTFALESSAFWPALPEGARGFPVTVRAFAPGRPIACVSTSVPAEIRVVMAPGAVLEGTLLLEDGTPLAGAVLEAVAMKSVQSPRIDPLLPQAASGPDGSFRIDGLAAEPHALLVLRPGLPPRIVKHLRPGDGPREIRLAPPFDIRGTVRGPDGASVPGAVVLWVPEDRSEGPTQARAGEDGSFVLRGVARVRFRLRIGSATAPEDPGEFVQTATPLLDPGDEPRAVVLDRGLSVEGIIEDPTGAPSAATHVTAQFEREGIRLARVVQSGPDGSFRLTGLPSGRVVLRAVGRALAGEVEAEAGSTGVRIRLREATGAAGRESFLAGRAVDAAGKPLFKAEVRLLGPSGDGEVLDHCEAALDGRFGFRANTGVRYTLTVSVPGGATAWLDGVPGGSKDLVLRVGAEPGGSLRGRVVDGSGKSAAGVPVHAFRIPGEAKERGTCAFESGGPTSGALPRSTVTGPDGAFDLGSPPGRWTVLAGSPGRGPAPVASATWDAAEPRTLEVETAAGRTLRATVSTGDTPPAAVEVRLESLLPAPAPVVAIRVRPGPDGMIELPGLPEGPVVVLLFDAKGKETGRATVEPGEPGAPPVEVRPGR